MVARISSLCYDCASSPEEMGPNCGHTEKDLCTSQWRTLDVQKKKEDLDLSLNEPADEGGNRNDVGDRARCAAGKQAEALAMHWQLIKIAWNDGKEGWRWKT